MLHPNDGTSNALLKNPELKTLPASKRSKLRSVQKLPWHRHQNIFAGQSVHLATPDPGLSKASKDAVRRGLWRTGGW